MHREGREEQKQHKSPTTRVRQRSKPGRSRRRPAKRTTREEKDPDTVGRSGHCRLASIIHKLLVI